MNKGMLFKLSCLLLIGMNACFAQIKKPAAPIVKPTIVKPPVQKAVTTKPTQATQTTTPPPENKSAPAPAPIINENPNQTPVKVKSAFPLSAAKKGKMLKSFKKIFNPNASRYGNYSSPPVNGKTSLCTITKEFPTFPNAGPKTTSIPGSAFGCDPFNVNIQKSFDLITADPTSPTSLLDKLYPGALFNAHNLVNGSFSAVIDENNLPVIHESILNTNLTPQNSEHPSSSPITSISKDAINTTLRQLYASTYADASLLATSSPALDMVDAYIVESAEQLTTSSNHLLAVNTAVTFDIPVEQLNIAGSVSTDIQANQFSSSSFQKNKSYAVLTYRAVFYTADLFRPGTGADNLTIFNTEAAPVADDLLYINKVDYGRMVYVIVEAECSRQELSSALKTVINVDTKVTVKDNTSGIGGGVSNTTNIQDSVNARQVFKNSSTRISIMVYGGAHVNLLEAANSAPLVDGIENSTSPTAAYNKIITFLTTNLSNTFSGQNIPAPIGFSCKFARDGKQAYVNIDCNYFSQSCRADYRYDLSLALDKIVVYKANDGGSKDEELFGNVKIVNYNVKGTFTDITDHVLWTLPEPTSSVSPHFLEGERTNVYDDSREYTPTAWKNLKYDDAIKLKFQITTDVYDDESAFNPHYKQVTQLNETGIYTLDMDQMNGLGKTPKTELLRMPESSTPTPIQFYNDEYFDFEMTENGETGADVSRIGMLFKLKAKVRKVYN